MLGRGEGAAGAATRPRMNYRVNPTRSLDADLTAPARRIDFVGLWVLKKQVAQGASRSG